MSLIYISSSGFDQTNKYFKLISVIVLPAIAVHFIMFAVMMMVVVVMVTVMILESMLFPVVKSVTLMTVLERIFAFVESARHHVMA